MRVWLAAALALGFATHVEAAVPDTTAAPTTTPPRPRVAAPT